ncbi:Glycosyl transferase, group 1 [Chitinispirillum alkaliphilum]|nr:Glycosyl transferase, group 1 [Chitinispirillum alkaliphilum]
MKICILTTSFPAHNGHHQSPFVFNFAKTLSEKVNVDIICPFYAESSDKEERWGNLKIHRFRYLPSKMQTLISGGGIPSNFKRSLLAKLQLPLLYLSMLFKSVKYVKECDIIHVQWSLTGLIGMVLKNMYKKPLILTERGSSLNEAMKFSVTRKVLTWILKSCDYITTNNFEQLRVINTLGFTKNIETIPNGIDVEKFSPQDQIEIRQKLGLPLNRKIVLYVGWLIENKGISSLLECCKMITEIIPELLFLLVGEGIDKKNYMQYVVDNGLEGNVKFTGAQKPASIPHYMNAADVLILPSFSEGRPNVVPEAMACGLPVIATNVNGTPEFIKSGIDGVLVEPGKPECMKDELLKLICDEKFYASIKEKCRSAVITNNLTWENTADRYIRIYGKMLENV